MSKAAGEAERLPGDSSMTLIAYAIEIWDRVEADWLFVEEAAVPHGVPAPEAPLLAAACRRIGHLRERFVRNTYRLVEQRVVEQQGREG
jgi:hypothetical protein